MASLLTTSLNPTNPPSNPNNGTGQHKMQQVKIKKASTLNESINSTQTSACLLSEHLNQLLTDQSTTNKTKQSSKKQVKTPKTPALVIDTHDEDESSTRVVQYGDESMASLCSVSSNSSSSSSKSSSSSSRSTASSSPISTKKYKNSINQTLNESDLVSAKKIKSPYLNKSLDNNVNVKSPVSTLLPPQSKLNGSINAAKIPNNTNINLQEVNNKLSKKQSKSNLNNSITNSTNTTSSTSKVNRQISLKVCLN